MSLIETDVPIENVVTTDPEKAGALENDLRAKILDMLADEAMTVEEIHEELERRGTEKAETTVRHHVNVLSDAEMVELARLEETGGATQKYYESNTRVFSYQLPDGADETLAPATESVTRSLEGIVDDLSDEHGDEIEAVAREMTPCEYCATQHYEEFVLRELIDRALIELTEDGSLENILD